MDLDFLVNHRLIVLMGLEPRDRLFGPSAALLLCSSEIEASPLISILSSSLPQASVVCFESNHEPQTGIQAMLEDPE